MSDRNTKRHAPGVGFYTPYTVDQLREGERYELDQGRRVYVAPTGEDGGQSTISGGELIVSDPSVKTAGIDVGHALSEKTLRAPDISVGDLADKPGWHKGAPALAVEYASSGQDEAELKLKIKDLLAAGTRFIWVVRLLGVRRVEVYEPEKPMRVAHIGEDLLAPGVLQNPIPVQALFDRQLAHELTLRNLLQRKGYQDLDAVREESRQQGVAEGRQQGVAEGRQQGVEEGHRRALQNTLQSILRARGLSLSPDQADRVAACHDVARLERWTARAVTASTAVEIFE